MKKYHNGNQYGASSAAMTGNRPATPSTSAESRSISATSGTTPNPSPSSRLTKMLEDAPEKLKVARMMMSFAVQLRALGLVIPKNLTLPNGEKGWAIFMPADKWEIDPQTKELRPR